MKSFTDEEPPFSGNTVNKVIIIIIVIMGSKLCAVEDNMIIETLENEKNHQKKIKI